MIILFLVGLGILFYPTLSNYYNEKNQVKSIYNYETILNSESKIDFDEILGNASEYNERLKKLSEPLLNYKKAGKYNDYLNVNGDGMIGYITIDKIKVELPIYHGTSNDVLNSSVGHLEGTSLPVGGLGTHSVLSAHRGLPSSKLFTDLDKLEVGDTFKITVLNKVLVYKVDKISIVKPTDVSNLKIDKNNDYVTLLTCTPYGINTHRLLVRGVRVDDEEKKTYVTTEAFKINKLLVIPASSVPIIMFLVIILMVKPVKKKNDYEEFIYPHKYKNRRQK